jgi:HEAT repeat protein
MRTTLSTHGVVLAALVAAPHLVAQSLADRVNAVKDGSVTMTYAARPDVCGDGADVAALGRLITVYPSMRGHGHSNTNCFFGPVRSVITRRDGEVTAVRTYIGSTRRADPAATDLGTVSAPAAAAYFLGVASTASGRAASGAVMAAAVADSADIWRQLLAIARDDNRPNDAQSSALFWMSGVAPPEAAAPLATLARTGGESKSLREGAIMTLAQLRDGAGVPTLIEMARRDDGDQWLRERSIFWLGNADDDRARTTLRALAASDTLGRSLRDQAIFALGFLDRDGDNGAFLRSLYGRLDDRHLKDKVIQAVAQMDGDADQRWLVDRVLDANEPVDLRKQALFWRGQKNSAPLGDLLALYPRLDSRELRDHYVFVLSQRQESAAVDKLIDLARNDTDREIRSKATFWLGQSRDPRASKFLEERISK